MPNQKTKKRTRKGNETTFARHIHILLCVDHVLHAVHIGYHLVAQTASSAPLELSKECGHDRNLYSPGMKHGVIEDAALAGASTSSEQV